MLTDKDVAKQLDYNISKIDHMLVGYMNFAKEEGNEGSEVVKLRELIGKIVLGCNDSRISFVYKQRQEMPVLLRKSAIERAISNLLNNALKYCLMVVKISLTTNRSMIKITVEDDGPGIKKAMYEEVFAPFVKVQKSSEGYGLGLTIVKSVVQSHGGNVKLAKSNLGGLRAVIIIPI
jgi:two-component system osmolarity sensor histidine kinase EnvZ